MYEISRLTSGIASELRLLLRKIGAWLFMATQVIDMIYFAISVIDAEG